MNILLIAYYYPPLGGGGSVRPRAMADYLRRGGHRVTVLTHSFDRDQWSDQEIRIYDCTHNSNRRGLRRLQWLFFRGIVEMLNALGSGRTIHGFWLRRIQRRMKRIWQQVQPDIVLATYPPAETLEAGLEFRRRYSVPLVTDFRDGLLFEPVDPVQMQRFPAVLRRYRYLEKAVTLNAAAVIAAHPVLAAYWSRRHRTCQWIASGYTAADYVNIKKADLGSGQIHLVHTGGFAASDPGCDAGVLAAAVEDALRRQPDLNQRLRLHLVGKLLKKEKKRFNHLEKNGVARLYGILPRQRSLEFQAGADLLVMVVSPRRASVIPGKFYEYLAALRPILVLNSSGTVAHMVTASRLGRAFAADDKENVSSFLIQFCENPGPRVQPAMLHKTLEIREAFQGLDKVLKEISLNREKNN